MQCPNCKKENDPENSYCIFCGSVLKTPDVEPTPETVPGDKDVTPGEAQALREEIGRLGKLVALMQERLVILERVQGISAPQRESRPAPPAVTPVKEAIPPPEPAKVTPAVTPPPPKPRTPTAIEREWEQILGGSWLARIGVLAIIIGVGFFLKYAFDQNWLGPTARVIMGAVAGLAMLGGGHYWRKKYPTFAQAISGGGIALLYLSVFAAYSIFGLIGFFPAVALLLLISVGSALLALRYDSMALAILSIVGAFLAPFVLSVSTGGASGTGGTVETDQSFWLLVYVMVVDLGVLWLSTFRNWRWFTLLALFGSLIVFGVWYNRFGDDVSLLTSMGSLTIIFLIFVAATTLYHVIWRRAPRDFDYILMALNATAYFSIGCALMWNELPGWVGGFSFLLALFYGGLAYAFIKKGPENITLAFFALGITLLFLTVAIPVQLKDTAWTTIAWAAQGTILMWLSLKFRMPLLRISSYIVFVVMSIRLLSFDTQLSLRDFTPFLNERFLAFIVSIAAVYLTGYLLWRERESLRPQEKTAWSVYPFFFAVANFFTIWVISFEVWDLFSERIYATTDWAARDGLRSARNLSLTAVWAVYAVILLVVGLTRGWRLVRLAALGLLVIPIVKVFIYDVFALEQVYRIIAFIGLGILLLTSAYLYQRHRKAIMGFLTKK
ncbi:MAG TPA: DUF2339 domain-containing protein [Dehalococcoidia bacterium]|nr:DUF2339 domain-containing protein [Dehalococcoidia bacterium]